MSRLRRALALLLLGLVLLPWYRLLSVRASGPSAEQALRLGPAYLTATWVGLVGGLALVALASRLVAPSLLAGLQEVCRRWLLAPPSLVVGTSLGLVAAGGAAVFSVLGLGRRPVLIDGVVQLIQARYLAAGRLGGPALEDPAFWQIQFMIPTDGGWVSQYPPGFPSLLAAGWIVQSPWLVGPLALGVTVLFTTLAADRLFPDDRAVGRLGATLAAMSPFLAFHAGGFMSHAPAAAFVALAVYAALRAADGSWWWAILAGAAVGAAFATRPLVGAVLGVVATAGVWALTPGPGLSRSRAWSERVVGALLGSLPIAALIAAYNTRTFGSATRFGWVVASGPSQAPGFHADPWGSPYGPLEALAFTAQDLVGLGLDLLQTPLPLVVLVAIHLFRADRLAAGTRVAAAWALIPVVANVLYWHHDLFMGPRMLYEAAPGWCLLVAASVMGILRSLPEPDDSRNARPVVTRTGAAAVLTIALVAGLVVAGPGKLASYARQAVSTGIARPAPEVQGPALVFVHDDWQSRLGARMSALGMRLDSVRAALRGVPTCEVERWVRDREVGLESLLAGDRGAWTAGTRELVMPSGSRILTHEGETLTPECERQAAADYAGVLALAPYLWQGDLPALGGDGAMYVRDLGPERNGELIERHGERRPFLMVGRGATGPLLLPYDEGIEQLWTVR